MTETIDITERIKKNQATKPKGSGTAIVDLVAVDLKYRKAFDLEKYGEALMAHNGRDALVDAYQEALDLCIYLRQALEERANDVQN